MAPSSRSVLTMPKIAEEEEALKEVMEEEEEEEEAPMQMSLSVPPEGGGRPRRRNESETFPVSSGVRVKGMRQNFSTPHLRPFSRRESMGRRMSTADTALGTSAQELRLARPMSRRDIFYTGSIRNLVEEGAEGEEGGLRSNRQSYISLRRRSSVAIPRNSLIDTPREDDLKEPSGKGLLLQALSSMTEVDLLRDPKFLLICTSNLFGFLGFYVPFVYLPTLAQKQEISPEQGALLLSVIGISNTLGRIVTGWISDFAWVDSLFVVNCSLVLSASCVFLFPFVATYEMLLVVGALFGLSIAAYISLTSIILVDLLGLERLTSAFGLLTMFRGAASIVGPPLAGAVFEAASLDISFYLAGSFLLAAGLLSILADVVRRRQATNSAV